MILSGLCKIFKNSLWSQGCAQRENCLVIWHWIGQSIIPAYYLKSPRSPVKHGLPGIEWNSPDSKKIGSSLHFQNMPRVLTLTLAQASPSPEPGPPPKAPCTHAPPWQRAAAGLNSRSCGRWCSCLLGPRGCSCGQRAWVQCGVCHFSTVWLWVHFLASESQFPHLVEVNGDVVITPWAVVRIKQVKQYLACSNHSINSGYYSSYLFLLRIPNGNTFPTDKPLLFQIFFLPFFSARQNWQTHFVHHFLRPNYELLSRSPNNSLCCVKLDALHSPCFYGEKDSFRVFPFTFLHLWEWDIETLHVLLVNWGSFKISKYRRDKLGVLD